MQHKADNNAILQAALSYAAKTSLKVFPVPPGEKKSYVSKKFASDGERWGATSDEKTIRKYWRKWPEANVGLPTGAANGFFVVEIDTTEGHAKLSEDGQVALDQLIAEHGGEWPETRTVRSPSGSKHFYFAAPPGRKIKNSDSLLGKGIDVRGDGGMVVAPPSVNPKYPDRRYEFINPTTRLALAPDWLLDLVCEKESASPQSGEAQASIDKLDAAMQIIPNDGAEWSYVDRETGEIKTLAGWEGWAHIGLALYRACGGSDAGFAIFDRWSAKNAHKYNSKDTRERWYDKFAKSPPERIGAGTIFMLANAEQKGWSQDWDRAHAIDPAIAELNKQYALVIIGDGTAIMNLNDRGEIVSLLKIDAFKQWLANRHVPIGNNKTMPLAMYWLTHPQRRQYRGIEFCPNGKAQVGYFNLWRGFAVKTKKGHCAKFLHHLKVNVCKRNKKLYRMVIGWFAQMVQHPEEKTGTTLVIRGDQGTGKTKVGKIIGRLFPDHYLLVSSAFDIFSNGAWITISGSPPHFLLPNA